MNTQTTSTVKKCVRESVTENTPKNYRCLRSDSLYLANANSPIRFVQVMDKRFEKLTEQLQTYIKTMFRENEDRLLSEIDKKLKVTLSEINNLNERVTAVESFVNDMTNAVSTKMLALTDENKNLKRQITVLKNHVRQQQNSTVAHDIRIHGIPVVEDENLSDIYSKLSTLTNINAPTISAIYRVGGNNKYPKISANEKPAKTNRDPDIIIRFKCPAPMTEIIF